MKRLQSFLTLLVVLLVSVSASWAATITVGPGKDYSTIQAAVTAASGGDIIEVYTATYTENVNIPGGKNGLIIREASGENATLDGTTVANPKVAFRVASDNVTIDGFTIENYNYTGATNVAYGQAQRGVGIEAINASSQHTFKNNTITNCNWGIYVREGNNITVQDNAIDDFVSTSFIGTWDKQGGVGIAFLSAGIAMDGNVVKSNNLNISTTNPNYGIVYGRIGDNVGADFVQINSNSVNNADNTGFFAYGIFNIKTGESVDFSTNVSYNNYAALDIVSSVATDNDDVTITNNSFWFTASPIEVRTSDDYSGERLWEVMVSNGNDFTNGSDISNTIVSVEYSNDIITSDGTNRFILNDLDAAITEAENYMNSVTNDGRVYVTNGTYTSTATATVNGLPAGKKLLIQGESLAAIITNDFAGTILDIQSPLVEVDPITFTANLSFGNVIAISTSAAGTHIHDVVFTSVNTTSNYNYTGIRVSDGADNVEINNNTLTGRIGYGIDIETDNTSKAIIECNTFNGTVGIATSRGIFVRDINAGGDIKNIEIISNTFSGLIYYPIQIILPTASSGNILIGDNNKGNIFTSSFTSPTTATAIELTQAANNQVTINYNKFDDTFDFYLRNNGTFDVNAGFNYWKVTGTNYATVIPAEFAGTGAANISWLPIYTNGTDQDLATCGFQPDDASLWSPVYTATTLGNNINDPTNEFFLTIVDALADANTVATDHEFVYVFLSYPAYTYNEVNTLGTELELDEEIDVLAAHAQPANGNVKSTPKVVGTANNKPVFVINTAAGNNDNVIDGLTIIGTGLIGYPIRFLDVTTTNVTISNCTFDIGANTDPQSAIYVYPGPSGSITNLSITNNTFLFDYSNVPVNFARGITDQTATNVTISNNTFTWGGNLDTPALVMNSGSNYNISSNTFENQINFENGLAGISNVFIIGNTFHDDSNSPSRAIEFIESKALALSFHQFVIGQNSFDNVDIAIDFANVALDCADYDDFDNFMINYNSFKNIGADAFEPLATPCANKLNAINNYWDSNYGPIANEDAPAWHDDFGSTIISNAYGYLYNQSNPNAVPITNATGIQYVPWWNNIAGTPGTYTGTSFAPIENNEAIPEYFASLIFAIDATTTGFDIYMQDVPDWNTSGTVYYVESNTIENAGKNLDIWGQPFFPPTTKIATVDNDILLDNMFFIENGTFNINFLELTYDASSNEDIGIGVRFDNNGQGTIDWSYINKLRGTVTSCTGVYLFDNTSTATITNSVIQDLDAPFSAYGVAALGGAKLTVDNTEFKGRNNLGAASLFEDGIFVANNSDLTLTNSVFRGYHGNSGEGYGILLSNNSPNPVGSISIYQNIFENNEVGLRIGYNNLNDNYSSISVYNNIIRNNDAGLIYDPIVASTLNVENNNWGSDNGPRSENQAGGTQENTYNETAQGNGVYDASANSTIDFIPWRRASIDDLSTKIAGPRFAPIVRTNAANLAQGLYSNFNDAEADLLSNQKVYAYAGTYSEHIKIDVSNVQFIGKLAPSTYSVGWIIAPNSPIFVNAWTNGAQGANANAPKIISGGLAQPLLDDDINNFSNVSFKGFIFNTQATTAPYVGNPTEAINFNLKTDDITFSNITFEADANDKGIVWGSGQHDIWDITYNKYEGTAPGYFAYVDAQTANTNMLINNNKLNYGAIYINKDGSGSITNMDITYNEFSNTNGAITLNGTSGGAAQVITNLNVSNNIFEASNTYAFLVDAAVPDNIVNGSDWTTEVEVTNNAIVIPSSAQIVVGFANPTPLATYSNEITATCNWWGDLSGPTYSLNPGGNGGLVSDGVFFAPWLSGNNNSALFGFTPMDACNAGERVWVNNDANPATKTIIFPSLQWAVQHSSVVNGTNAHIFVSDNYNTTGVNENITVNWNTPPNDRTLYAETITNELKVNGDFALAGTNPYNLFLGSALRVTGNLILDNIGCQGQFILGDKDLTVEGNITDASYGAVVTNDLGYLVKENVVTGGINRFPVTFDETGTVTPAEFVVNTNGFTAAQNNKLKVRVNNSNPVDYKGMGEDGYDVNNIWVIDWTNNNGVVDPQFAMTLRFLDDLLNDTYFTPNKTISYAAYWDLDPVATQWTTRKSTSSWNGSDGVQVTNLNLDAGLTEWALFSGSTSFALSTRPTQAKYIQWIGGNDRNLTFQWKRNGLGNQYYAILGIKGSMTAAPATFTPSATGDGSNGPWVASATDRNFADGYVDNVTAADWVNSLFHNGAALPADVKVLKVAPYSNSLSENVTVTNLDQGTYYTFFVANFNYGDGTTPVSAMETGADGMANYELIPNTLNPRTRKTQPAVYMTLDGSPAFLTDADNQPNIVYGTTPPTFTTTASMFNSNNHWSANGVAINNPVVENQYNGDDLIGGNYMNLCTPTDFPANNILLYFKGYGNNGGANWGIKYSENNSTYTFTTPLVNSNTSRTRSVETKYYLVSAYDGDGKVAALYDNNQDLQIIFDDATTLSAAISGTHPTCVGNSVTFTSSATSTPAATFVGWEVSTDNITYAPVVFGTNVSSTGSVIGTDINFSSLVYADNGKWFKAKYTSTSVCDYPNLGATYYTNPIQLQVYDNTLTGTQPNVSGDTDPYICSDAASVTFTSSDNGPLTSPNTLTLQGWYIDDGVLSGLITANGTYNNVNYTVTGIGTNSGTITVSNANMSLLDGIKITAEWKNGDCATTTTSATTLNIVDKPVVTSLATPAGVCINQDINIASVSTPANAGATQTIQWQYSTNNITFTNLTDGATSDVTIAGATTANLTITPHTMAWDGYYVRVVYTHSENGTDCITESNAVQIDVLPSPVFNAIADQTVCENTVMTVTAVDANPPSWSGNIVWYHTSVAPANMMTNGGTYFGSTVTINGVSDATFQIDNATLLWDGKTVIAFNDNGACTGQEEFVVNVDETPTVGTATVTAGEVCEGGSVDYSTTYTPTATATVVWYYNGVPVVDGTSVTGDAFNNATVVTAAGTTTLTLSQVTVAIDGVLVYAEVDNGTCSVVTSNSVSADIETIPVAPATVGAQNIFSHRFDVTWTGVANADDYDIEVSELADFSVLKVSANVTAPAVTWTGMANCVLDPAKTYYFRVRANNQCGNGPWNTSNLVTLDPTVVSIDYTAGDGVFGNVEVGSNSPADTYTITYYQLDAGLEVVVPAGYEIMPTGSLSWLSGTVDLTSYLTLYLGTPGLPLTLDVQVRFSPTICGLETGDLVHSSLETCAGVTEMLETVIVTSSDDVSGTGVVAAPTVAATNGIVMENTAGTFSATWTNGNGTNRLVILSTSETLSASPVDNTPYVAGDMIGGGTVVDVLANPTAASTITVPVDGNNYYVHIWEYNACGTNTEIYDNDYYTFQPYYLAFGSIDDPQTSGVESELIDLYLTQRNGDPILNPFANFNVTINNSESDLTFSTNPTPVTILSGSASTTFKFTWTNNCGVENGYLTATATNINGTESNTFNLNVSTPTMQSRIIVWVGVPCAASTTLKWTNGNGAGRLVVAREGALPIAPTDFQVYTTNSDWSARSASNLIGDNTYAMGTTTGTNKQITLTNLTLGSTYYFRIFEYNGCDPQLRKYLTTNATFNPRSRTINCKEGNDLYDIVLDRFNATSNSGKGIINFNTLYEANISGFELRRINVSDEEMDGMLVGSYMNNSELVAEGNTMTGKSYNFTDNSALLEVGKTYLYQLTAIAFDGTRIDVAETELTINDDIHTGISEFSVSPVTVTNNEAIFDLTVNKAQNVTITMFDVTGQKVASIANDARVNRGTQQFTTNIQNITNGTYMIVVESDGISAVQKFQIVR